MKKLFVFVLLATLSIISSVSAQTCDCENLQAQIDALTARIEALESGAPVTEAVEETSGEFEQVVVGDFTLDLIGWELKKSLTGDDYIEITYLFTNNSNDTASCGWKIQQTAYQDGIEAKSRIIMNSESTTDIRPGKSIEVKQGFTLRSLTEPIEIGYKPFLSSGDPVAVRFIEIK